MEDNRHTINSAMITISVLHDSDLQLKITKSEYKRNRKTDQAAASCTDQNRTYSEHL